MMVKNIQVGQIGTNCYLFGDEDSKLCALVDPGDEPGRVARMVEESGMTLRYIFITHGHYDHVLAVDSLQTQYPDVEVFIHPAELNAARIPNNYMQMMPCNNVKTIGEGDSFPLGSLTVEIMNTPGHSPGSLVLKVGEALFTGDTLFQGSCGRTDFAGGSYEQMLQSLKRLHDLPGDYAVYPGHESSSKLSLERQRNSYMQEAVKRVR